MESNTETKWKDDYVKWYQLSQWIKNVTKGFNRYHHYELLNCVTRYFTSLSIVKEEGKEESNDSVYQKFMQELKDKGIKINTDTRDIRSVFQCNTVTVPHVFSVKGSCFTCGDFKSTVPTKRYKLLREKSSNEEVLRMLLKYAMFPSVSLSWQVPHSVYKYMFDNHNLTLEGCASPLNSQILPLGGKYCTPFESDKVFGSVGNIFDIDLEGEVAIINPPFVEDFMLALSQKIMVTLNAATKTTTVIFIAPAWTDAESHIMLSNTLYLKQKFDLCKGEYFYEDSETGNKVSAKFNSTIFVFSNHQVDFSGIVQYFK